MAATEDTLGELHTQLAQTLTDLVKADGTSAAVLAVAAKFLKDNNITCTPATDNALGELEAQMRAKRQKAQLTAKERQELAAVGGIEHLMH